MTESFRLKEIRIKGFRGYGNEERRIDLSGPVVLLYGGNRSGKSSTTNAIEWALYGGEVTDKAKTGITERKGWLARNRQCESASVELVLESDGKELRVFRELGGKRKRSGGSFHFVDENGEKLADQAALWRRLGMEARDFMSSAYLHQEVIRDIVISDPRIRKEALDRLLGISDLRNLLGALGELKTSRYEKDVNDIYEHLQRNINARASAYRETMGKSLAEGEGRGMEKGEFTLEGFNGRCASAAAQSAELARRAGIEGIEVEPPADIADFTAFKESATRVVRRLRDENPGSVSRSELIKERSDLEGALAAWRSKAEAKRRLLDEKGELEKGGSLEALRERLAGKKAEAAGIVSRLESINARLPVMRETVKYLEKLEDRTAETACPSCEQPIVPEEVLRRLREAEAGMGEEANDLSRRSRELDAEIKAVSNTVGRLEEILGKELPEAEEAVTDSRAEIGRLLDRPLSGEDDPEKLVGDRLQQIEKKLDEAARVLQQYNEGINAIEDAVQEAGLIRNFLEAQERIATIDAITDSEDWKEMDAARGRLFRELEMVKRVGEAIGAVLDETTEEKLQSAEDAISSCYRALVERPDFESIWIDPVDHEVYAVSGEEREKVVTFFNQGDMNCAALSIFLALGGSPEREGGPAFLILDDPSQSLDSEQKRKLASLIDRVAADRQVLLATMDEELLEALKGGVSKAKRVYRFGEWDPVKGPSISEE